MARRLTLSNPAAILQADGITLAAVSANAKRKQYDVAVTIHITETGTDKSYFDFNIKYTAVPFSMMVAMEDALLDILNKLQDIGEITAFGQPLPPTPPVPTP